MSEQPSHLPLPATARAGSGLASSVPARSQTDPVEPTQQRRDTAPDSHKRVHSNTLPGHPSRGGSHRHHHHHSHRHRAKEAVQSAIDLKPPISFDHILRRDRKSPGSSRTGSSGPLHRDGEARRTQQQQQQPAQESAVRRSAQRADVERVEADNARREEELRKVLNQAEELGMRSTRELDDTYYAILDKASILRSTVAGLQQLAAESKRMHQKFLEDSKVLLQDTTTNIEGFGELKEQEQSIAALVDRLHKSRSEADRLNERLEQARERVEEFEKRRKERLATRRKQWNATWGTTLGVVVLILALLLLRGHHQVAEQWGDVEKTIQQVEEMAVSVVSNLRPAPSPSEDPYLQKLFEVL